MGSYDVKQEVTDKYSLRGRVFHKIRDDILSGRYRVGEELREVAIGEEIGVSRTPVREAFRQLELEGLIRIVPNKGAYVTGITAKDVRDIYMIRSLLEGLCARWATENISKEQMEEMEENIESNFNVEKLLEEKELNDCIIKKLKSIGENEYLVFTKFYYQDKKIKDISNELGLSISNTKTILHRTRKKVKEFLKMGGLY